MTFGGSKSRNVVFEIDDDVDVYGSCAAILRNVHWIFGGAEKNKKQVRKFLITSFSSIKDTQAAKIVGCRVIKDHQLPFVFEFGACDTFNDEVLLCFGKDMVDNKKCRM